MSQYVEKIIAIYRKICSFLHNFAGYALRIYLKHVLRCYEPLVFENICPKAWHFLVIISCHRGEWSFHTMINNIWLHAKQRASWAWGGTQPSERPTERQHQEPGWDRVKDPQCVVLLQGEHTGGWKRNQESQLVKGTRLFVAKQYLFGKKNGWRVN